MKDQDEELFPAARVVHSKPPPVGKRRGSGIIGVDNMREQAEELFPAARVVHSKPPPVVKRSRVPNVDKPDTFKPTIPPVTLSGFTTGDDEKDVVSLLDTDTRKLPLDSAGFHPKLKRVKDCDEEMEPQTNEE